MIEVLPNGPQVTRLTGSGPGADDRRTSHVPARSENGEHAGHGGHAHARSGAVLRCLREQLAGLGRTRSSIRLRRCHHQFGQILPQVVVDLDLPVLTPAIGEPVFAERQVPARHPHGRRGHAPQARCDAVRAPAGLVEQHDRNPPSQSRVPGPVSLALQTPLHPARQPDYNASLHVGLQDGASQPRRKNPTTLFLEPHSVVNRLSAEEKITCRDPESQAFISSGLRFWYAEGPRRTINENGVQQCAHGSVRGTRLVR